MLEKVVQMLPVIKLDIYGAFILVLGMIFFYMLWKANRQGNLIWTDLITNKGTTVVSLTKMLQLIGGMVGTWLMIKLTLQEKLTEEYLMIYLTYVGAIEGWSKFVAARYGATFDPNGNGSSNGNGNNNGYGNGYGNGNGRGQGYGNGNGRGQGYGQGQNRPNTSPASSPVDETALDAALPKDIKP
jgi:hypothetical protein